MKRVFLIFTLVFSCCCLHAKLPDLAADDVTRMAKDMMRMHASHKELSPELVERILSCYIDELDPTKTYFVIEDIEPWVNPSPELTNKVLQEYEQGKFSTFEDIHGAMVKAIERQHCLKGQIDEADLPKDVPVRKWKDLKWTEDEDGLLLRLKEVKSLQNDALSTLDDDIREKAMKRINKRTDKYENELLTNDTDARIKKIYSMILKGTAGALDSQTAYFTPSEATQFMIGVQQKLTGIGVQLSDNLNGFLIEKVLEAGPASRGKELKEKDLVIAVDGEPVVGMDILEAVELIRGEKGTPVVLTVLRDVGKGDEKQQQKIDIKIIRDEVVLEDSRIETSTVPYGRGVIACVKLFAFYQDEKSSSADDIVEAIDKVRKEHELEGVILDLRYNSGGMLTQAVDVTGLFINKGVVVSIKDHRGQLCHLRDIDGKRLWSGPLIVLISKFSASAAEIVAQTLQDYGRALIVGDEHSYGKGTFQTFTLGANRGSKVNPKGEYKVTQGRYYTVSGASPQLVGVKADIVIPSNVSELEIGEEFSKYPLKNDTIKANFEDDLADIPFFQRQKIAKMYRFNLQPRLDIYTKYLDVLRQNTEERIKNNKAYQNFILELKNKDDSDQELIDVYNQSDLQLNETINVIKDLIFLLNDERQTT